MGDRRVARFTQEQVRSYEDSLKSYRDLKNSMDTARDEGMAEGRMLEKLEVARNLLSGGVPVDVIARSTGLPESVIEKLR